MRKKKPERIASGSLGYEEAEPPTWLCLGNLLGCVVTQHNKQISRNRQDG